MEITFIFYVLISIIVISGSLLLNRSYSYSSSKDSWPRGVLSRSSNSGTRSNPIVLSILLLLVSILFGTRWFTISGNFKLVPQVSTVWPPQNSMNSCPDYTALTSTYACKDIMGVSAPRSGGTSNGVLELKKTNGDWKNVIELCAEVYNMGLAWESVCIPNSTSPFRPDVIPPRPA